MYNIVFKRGLRKRFRKFKYKYLVFVVFTLWMLTTKSETEMIEAGKQTPKSTFLRRLSTALFKVKDGIAYVALGRFLFGDTVCKDTFFPIHLLTNKDTWLPVDAKKTTYVFSAYLVHSENKIVIIGAKTKQGLPLGCQLWYTFRNNTMKHQELISVSWWKFPEGRDFSYGAGMFTCNLMNNKIPNYVSLVTKRCATPLHLLQLEHRIKPVKQERKFTVCLSPLNYDYNRDYELVEWIELNRIMGAQKFIIYNYSSASNVENVLDFYSVLNIVEVVQWRLPMEVQIYTSAGVKGGQIYYFGQLAALNDCLYRQKYYSEFVVNIDLDEFIVPGPEGINMWTDIIEHVSSKEAGAYLFRNVFFRKDWTNNDTIIYDKEKVDKYNLTTLQKVERENKIFPPGHRSKYFVRTLVASNLMIHTVPSLPLEKKYEVVSTDLALLHHYRNWEEYRKTGHTVVIDMRLPNKYSEILLKNVERMWSALLVSN